MTNVLTQKFRIPPQDLAAPTLFEATVESLQAWLANLPKTNLGHTTRALYLAVTELNRVQLAPIQRVQLLETLRPSIYLVVTALRRHYLGQPLVLGEQPKKVAQLAHILYEQLATGYILVATHTLGLEGKSGFSQPQHAIATAIHRAIVEHSQNLLRDCQLYRNPHPGCWYSLHQLAALARFTGTHRVAVADAEAGNSTIEAAYVRALLLGCAKPQQLRQEDMLKLFQQLLEWTPLVTLGKPEEALLVFDPAMDEGPIYREFAVDDHTWLGIDTKRLASHLLALRLEVDANLQDRTLSSDLLGQLAHSWSTASKRAFLRMEVNESVDITLGLTAAHHFASGEADFNLLLSYSGHQQLGLENANPFLGGRAQIEAARTKKDVWDSPYQGAGGAASPARVSLEIVDFHIREHQANQSITKDKDKFRSHEVNRINISPGGLCIKWPPDNNSQVRAGEIIGIRENNHKNWSVGVVRWLRLLESGPQLGIELMSPTVVPYGARVLQKGGLQGEYLRVLILPEMKQTGQPTTLLTPRLPFRAGQKVSLLYHDKETRIHLTRKIASTAAFSQFEFRRLSGIKTGADSNVAAAESDGSFDSLWDSL